MKTVKRLVEESTWEAHGSDWFTEDREQLEAKVEAAINTAIEQCAQIADNLSGELSIGQDIGDAIRATKSEIPRKPFDYPDKCPQCGNQGMLGYQTICLCH